jgi:GalNAc5-diNAcBac-PP-undecaprenol beta-1,3-glucosyltransferase
MSSKDPVISVIIPTHNRPALLGRAIQSILVNDTQGVVELIVISDVNDMRTASLASQLLRPQDQFLVRNGHPGPSKSRNLGLQLARGRHIAFLDDDDAWAPGYLHSLSSTDDLQCGRFLYSDCFVVTETRGPEGPVPLEQVRMSTKSLVGDHLFVRNRLHMSCILFPRHRLESARFDVFMRAYEDWEFLLAVFEEGYPEHRSFLASIVFEVKDQTTDRRGDSAAAHGINVILDYLYVYHKHPAPTADVAKQRSTLLGQYGIVIPEEYYYAH